MSIHFKLISALAFVFGLAVVSGCDSTSLRSSGNDYVLGNDDSGSDGGRDGGSDAGIDAGGPGDAGADAGSGEDGGCDGGIPISYAMDIQPIFNARCIRCHDEATHRGNLVLTAPGSWAQLLNIPSTCDSSVVRVAPADTAGSMLWRKCKPDPSRCLNPEQWILQGAMDN
jgi:hypothetical protein